MNSTAAGGQGGVVAPDVARHAYRRAAYPIVRIHLLGAMRATSYLGDDVLPRGKKARATLGYLCLAFGTAVPRARLASMLWDRVSDAQARGNFRHALSELCSAMGPLAAELISTGRASVRLNTDACWIDALALLESSSSDSVRSDLAVLCTGELLEGLDDASASFDQWLRRERTRFTEKLRGSLDSELRQIDRPGFDAKQVAAVARRLIAFDATHQGASRALMRALAKMGEQAQALREYDRCREALMKILHVEPSFESTRVYEAIRARSDRKNRKNETSALPTSTRFQRTDTGTHQPLPGRNRLRVGVLPFEGTGSAREENLAFSLSHEIAAALARFRWFDVITPISSICRPLVSFTSEDLLQRNQLDYAVDGVINRHGRFLQISVRLLDLTRCTQPVWSDRFELAAGELHRLNEMVTARIVRSIDPVILFIEGQPKRRESYGATGLLLLAIPLLYSMERKKFEHAGELIHQALEIDPQNAMALAWAAFWRICLVGQGWAQDILGTLAKAETLCLKAIEIDPDNADALGIYAHTCAWKKDFDAAVHYFDRSLRLNPNLAFIWGLSAATYCYISEPVAALKRLKRYRDLAPFDPCFCMFEVVYAIAYTFKGDYERAVLVGRRAVKGNTDFSAGYKPLIASLGHLGRPDEAKPYIAKLLSLETNFTIERFAQTYPFKQQSDRERYCEGLRLAGIPKR
jgi:DNA-binding SARP family transcriptional activator/TolB-like protein